MNRRGNNNRHLNARCHHKICTNLYDIFTHFTTVPSVRIGRCIARCSVARLPLLAVCLSPADAFMVVAATSCTRWRLD